MPNTANSSDVVSERVFATPVAGASLPDSLTLGRGALWVEYGNNADATGLSGASTIVEYNLKGHVEQSYTLAGHVDGLKLDPVTGDVWGLQNEDGNSTLTLIDPTTRQVSSTLSYAPPYVYGANSARGYDDVAFDKGKVYLSHTNPANAGDGTVEVLNNGNDPFGALSVTPILAYGATGLNVETGQIETIPQNDPDSLKTTPTGGLMLSSGDDGSITLIANPDTPQQSVSFVQIPGVTPGSAGLDDALFPAASAGTLYISDPNNNRVLQVQLKNLNPNDIIANVGSLNAVVEIDPATGQTTTLVAGLGSKAGGLAFVPAAAKGPVVQSESIFAVGADSGNATAPDSLTMNGRSIFVEYGNNADSTGKLANGGSSTIVQYSKLGRIEHTYSLPGEIDGLKVDPSTGTLWALQNQDANSHLYLIDPKTHQVGNALSYASPYIYGDNSARGYDDVAFDGKKVFLSYTNPTQTGDSVVQMLDNGNSPVDKLHTTSILRMGDTGTNLTTGQVNQALPVNDPDSLKTLADGSLILTSDHDRSLTFIAHPGTAQQSASFVTLPAGSSGLDDAIVPTSSSGTLYVANGGANDVLKVDLTGLNTNDVYVSVASDSAVVQIDPKTGAVTPVVTGLSSPHGLLFVPSGTAPGASGLGNLDQTLLRDFASGAGGNAVTATATSSGFASGSATPQTYVGAASVLLPTQHGTQTAVPHVQAA